MGPEDRNSLCSLRSLYILPNITACVCLLLLYFTMSCWKKGHIFFWHKAHLSSASLTLFLQNWSCRTSASSYLKLAHKSHDTFMASLGGNQKRRIEEQSHLEPTALNWKYNTGQLETQIKEMTQLSCVQDERACTSAVCMWVSFCSNGFETSGTHYGEPQKHVISLCWVIIKTVCSGAFLHNFSFKMCLNGSQHIL